MYSELRLLLRIRVSDFPSGFRSWKRRSAAPRAGTRQRQDRKFPVQRLRKLEAEIHAAFPRFQQLQQSVLKRVRLRQEERLIRRQQPGSPADQNRHQLFPLAVTDGERAQYRLFPRRRPQ